jgi:hypothetical protein
MEVAVLEIVGDPRAMGGHGVPTMGCREEHYDEVRGAEHDNGGQKESD